MNPEAPQKKGTIILNQTILISPLVFPELSDSLTDNVASLVIEEEIPSPQEDNRLEKLYNKMKKMPTDNYFVELTDGISMRSIKVEIKEFRRKSNYNEYSYQILFGFRYVFS
jgi:hypothetical protein